MLERKLLAASLHDREAYDIIKGAGVDVGEDLAPVWEALGAFYENDPGAETGDLDLLAASLVRGTQSPKTARSLSALLEELWATTVSIPNVRSMVVEQKRTAAGDRLAAAIAARRPDAEVAEALEQYQSAFADEVEDETEDVSWTSAIDRGVNVSNRIPVSPKVLNQYLAGGLLPGHNVTIFGRPESGKTALAITMACGFARRGFRTLYVGNEDPIEDLMLRAVCNLAGMTATEVAADPDAAETEAARKGLANLVMKELAPGSAPEIEALVRRYEPAVLIVDQLRNLRTGKSENYTQLLDQNAQAIRAIGKRNGVLTVSVTQAGDSAEGRAVLSMGDVDSSNTGIPGAADVMIGVGVTDDLDRQGKRMLTLCKNKPGRTRAQQLVTLDPYRSKMT